MSDILSFKDIVDEMKGKELTLFASAQYELIEKLQKENNILKEKTNHLEQLLQSKARPNILPISDEEIICIEQINILKSKSSNRELSLDEVKRLDLLIKNLRLLREQSTQVIDSLDYSTLKESDLVAALNSPKQTD